MNWKTVSSAALFVGLASSLAVGGATRESSEAAARDEPATNLTTEIGRGVGPTAAATGEAATTYGALPLSFERNQGQADEDVEFLARGSGYNLQLTASEVILAVGSPQQALIKMQLVGANPAPNVTGLDELPGRVNHLIGNDPSKWFTDVPTYALVGYESVYPGVDMVFKGTQGELEYDFLLAPGSHPEVISFAFQGVDDISIDEQGDLVLEVAEQSVRHRKPLIYQEIGGERKTVAGEYVLAASGEVGFEVAAYDATRPLVIDPVIEYTTTLGGSGDEEGLGIDVDAADNVYVVGYTSSSDFETATNLSGVFDAFVAKLNTTGDLVYATYFGGGGLDAASEIAVDSAGSAYIVGITDSTNFPAPPGPTPAQETNAGGFDAFVAKLDVSGGLVYATYLGGPGDENGSGIAIDDAGRAYVTGNTDSTTDFPTTTDAYQENYAGGELDVFVTELAPDGSSFPYSTYLGGIKQETGGGITVDAVSDVYITGTTTSIDFPTTAGSYQESYGKAIDVFVAKLNLGSNSSSDLVYSTYLAGTSEDRHSDIALDGYGNVYVTGYTQKRDVLPVEIEFPTTDGAYDRDYGGGAWDVFVAKLKLNNSAGSDLLYSTYLGGDGDDFALGLAVNGGGEAHVTGFTCSSDFPVVNAPVVIGAPESVCSPTFPGSDAFLVKLRPDGSDLVYSTYLGGSGHDAGYDVALDVTGGVYVTGSTDFTIVFVEKISATPAHALYVWRDRIRAATGRL